MRPAINSEPIATPDHPQFDLTPWANGAPARAGWYAASAERNDTIRRHHDGNLWSDWCHADAPEEDFDRARATPALSQVGIEYRGLTERSAAWVSAEMAA